MAREVQILTWCDVCYAAEEHVPVAATHEVIVDGKGYLIELCEAHEVALFKPLLGLTEHAADLDKVKGKQPAKKSTKTTSALTASTRTRTRTIATGTDRALPVGIVCPVAHCGQPYHGRSQSAMEQHVRIIHEVTFATLLGTECPVCGETYEMVGAHVSNSHPEVSTPALTGMTAAWWWASQNGDPHEVIKRSGLLPFVVGAGDD